MDTTRSDAGARVGALPAAARGLAVVRGWREPGHRWPEFPFGARALAYFDLAGIFGGSVVVADHIVIRGALHFHRPAGEDLSLFETTAMVGYRF